MVLAGTQKDADTEPLDNPTINVRAIVSLAPDAHALQVITVAVDDVAVEIKCDAVGADNQSVSGQSTRSALSFVSSVITWPQRTCLAKAGAASAASKQQRPCHLCHHEQEKTVRPWSSVSQRKACIPERRPPERVLNTSRPWVFLRAPDRGSACPSPRCRRSSVGRLTRCLPRAARSETARPPREPAARANP